LCEFTALIVRPVTAKFSRPQVKIDNRSVVVNHAAFADIRLVKVNSHSGPGAIINGGPPNGRNRLAAVAQIRVMNDCGNRYLALTPFSGGCPLISEADVHCRSTGCAMPTQRRGLASDCSRRHRIDTSDPLQPAAVVGTADRRAFKADLGRDSPAATKSWKLPLDEL
jgi:hypothetical protein